jgi:hypothetical protein
MDHRTLHNIQWDMRIVEGIEHLESFWNLRLLSDRHNEMIDEMERSMLAHEMNEFHRRCVNNDKPGRWHMLPFVWYTPVDYNGVRSAPLQLPIKVGSRHYEQRMAKYKARMDELKRRTPNYGRKI